MNARSFPLIRYVLVLGIGLSSAGFMQAAFALPAKEVLTTYYSDAPKRYEVGSRELLCNGQIVKEGIATRYFRRTVGQTCSSGGLPNPTVPCEFRADDLACRNLPTPRNY